MFGGVKRQSSRLFLFCHVFQVVTLGGRLFLHYLVLSTRFLDGLSLIESSRETSHAENQSLRKSCGLAGCDATELPIPTRLDIKRMWIFAPAEPDGTPVHY